MWWVEPSDRLVAWRVVQRRTGRRGSPGWMRRCRVWKRRWRHGRARSLARTGSSFTNRTGSTSWSGAWKTSAGPGSASRPRSVRGTRRPSRRRRDASAVRPMAVTGIGRSLTASPIESWRPPCLPAARNAAAARSTTNATPSSGRLTCPRSARPLPASRCRSAGAGPAKRRVQGASP